jgi:diguanylate cyclase (GGDEF)-like protein
MAAFFDTQLDFILFFYGLAFILLGAVCLAIARISERGGSWSALALFGFLHGGGEWLDLTALVLGDSPAFGVARIALMTVSFVLLMEFARLQVVGFGPKLPRLWLYVPLLSSVAVVGFIVGPNEAGAVARYGIGCVGSIAASLVFARLARGFSGTARYLAACAAVGFALYALAAGIIVPATSFWPASVFNYGWFNQVTGIPIQLARAMLACWIAFSIWAVWGQQLILEVSSTRYTQFLHRQFIWTLLAMTAILVIGWTLTEYLGGISKANVQREARGDIDLLAGRLAGETATVEAMVRALAGSPSMPLLLAGGNKQDNEWAKTVLDLDVEASGAKVGYILDRSGTIVAASDRSDASPLGTANYRSVSYFQKSIAGSAGYYFAFDAPNRERNYYASYPIRVGDNVIVGVAVLEKSLDAFEADLSRFGRAYFFVDPYGIVVLTNRPAAMLRTLWPLSAEERLVLERQFGSLNDRPMLEREITDATWIKFGGERDYAIRRYANHSRWSLVILSPIREIYASRIMGIVITLLVAIMTLIYFFGKERWVHDNVQMEKRLKLQELARGLRFQATTDPLTGLYNRLEFDQALVREMTRSTGYKTPLSLILYDIDQFKVVNDSHGHQIGDKVLTELSRFVANDIRTVDVLARWGGEEFVIMLPGCDGFMAQRTAEKLRDAIGRFAFDVVGTVTCSFGVACYVDGDTAETLLSRADAALYRAKINGRNRVELALPPAEAEPAIASVA